jgi:hypothetical protein
MQTTGAILLAVKLPSSMRMRRHAQDGRSARGLLYPMLYAMTSASKNAVKAGLTSDYQQCSGWLLAVAIFVDTETRIISTEGTRTRRV